MNTKQVHVDSVGFRMAHGKMPSGTGLWAFGPQRDTDAMSSDMFWHNGAFKDAKRAAKSHFAAKGVSLVHVQS